MDSTLRTDQRPPCTGLWRHPDFVKLWAGQTISLFGSEVTLLALPLTAALTLGATPAQMGLLGAVQTAPFLLGLFAGVWVDRLRRRPILMWADLGRAALLGSIPVAAVFSVLSLEQLYGVAGLVGLLSVCFNVAYPAYLPSVVQRAELIEGNSKLEMSRSVAHMGGPSLAGGLVQLVSAPIAIIVDALSFLVSALFLGLIRNREPAPSTPGRTRNVWDELGAGLRLVLRHHMLGTVAASTGIVNLFGGVLDAVFVVFVTRELHIEPAMLGLIYAVAGPGALLGVVIAERTARQLGIGPTIILAFLLSAVGTIFIPLARGPRTIASPLLMVAQLLLGMAVPLYTITVSSLIQAITPDGLQGRVNATMRFIGGGMIPVGALVGGTLGAIIGVRPTLVVGVVGMLGAVLGLTLSPVRTLRELPEPMTESDHIA
jgi:MFS family permease